MPSVRKNSKASRAVALLLFRAPQLHLVVSVDSLGFGRLARPPAPPEAQRSSLDADGSRASGCSETLGAERPPARGEPKNRSCQRLARSIAVSQRDEMPNGGL